MGVEFLNRTKKTIIKHIDRNRVALSTPTLFTINPSETARRVVGSLSGGASVSNGESLVVEVRNGAAHLRRGNALIGSLDCPSNDIIGRIERSGGAAGGVVHRVHKISRKVEISLC